MKLTIHQQDCVSAPVPAGISASAAVRNTVFSVLTKISNTSFNLLFAMPTHDYQRAFAEAKQLLDLSEQTVSEFIASIKSRLQQPEALALMHPGAETESFHSLHRWLPAVPQPLLSKQQCDKLISLALGQPAQRFSGLERRLPALNNLLVDEINQAAAKRLAGIAGKVLPELLRLKVVSDNLHRLHPLLPTAVWVAQILWSLRQQGILKALDGELRMQLHQWLSGFDARLTSADSARLALSDKSLFRAIDHWIEQRLGDLRGSDGSLPLVEAARSTTVPDTESRAPVANGQLRSESDHACGFSAEGWSHNSVLNNPAAEKSNLLLNVQTCYELVKREAQPANFAVGCAVRNENVTVVHPDFSAAQFSRTLATDSTGELYSRLQIECGESPLTVDGAAIPGERLRPLAMNPLAGAGDILMPFTADEKELPESQRDQVVSYVINSSLDLLSYPNRLSEQSLKVKPLDENNTVDTVLLRAGEMTADIPLKPGLFNHLLHQQIQQRETLLSTADQWGAGWPFAGVKASPVRALPAITGRQQNSSADVSVNDFMDSLYFKYPQQLENYSKVIVTLNQTSSVMDEEVPLKQALEMMQEKEQGVKLTLNSHPGWSSSFESDVRTFISGKFIHDFDLNKIMEWDSPTNKQAVWLLGRGIAKKGVEKVADIITKMTSPVWDVNVWVNDRINTFLKENSVDISKINGNTTVMAGVWLPSNHGAYHMPMLHPSFDGTWQPIGNYTLRQIFIREHLRNDNHFLQDSISLRYPVEIDQSLQTKIKQSDLQSDYIEDLKQVLSGGDVKIGMLILFRTMLEKAVDKFFAKFTEKKYPLNLTKLRESAVNGRFCQMQWNGYKLHNLVFMPEENETKGVIISLWDEKCWVVSIDPLSTLSLYGDGKAKDLLDAINRGVSIGTRAKSAVAEIVDNQIVINTSGKYIVEFNAKVFVKKYWQPATVDRAILSLTSREWIEKELLINFITTLKDDMNYLVKSPGEYQRDTAIEVLNTIATLIGLFNIPFTITTATGSGYMATKLFNAITSWKTSLALTSTFSIFPNLVRANTADRPDDAAKSYIDALLSLMGEGAGHLISKYGLRQIAGLFYQGGKLVKLAFNQLPDEILSRISQHANDYFALYRKNILQVDELSSAVTKIGEKYNVPFVDAKAPAPIIDMTVEFISFTAFFKAYAVNISRLSDLFTDAAKIPEIAWLYFQNKGFQVLFGGVVRWDNLIDASPKIHYIVRVKSQPPEVNSGFVETEDVIVDFSSGRLAPDDAKGESISGEKKWLMTFSELSQNRDKAISIEWFDNPQQAVSYYKKLQNANKMNIAHFANAMEVRPEWYNHALKRRALLEIETRQAAMLEEIYKIENEIELPDLNELTRDTASLRLGTLFAQGTLPAFDALSKKINVLLTRPISKQVVALPEGEYFLIGAELRGIRSDHQGNVTLVNYSAPARQIINNLTQTYAPAEILKAGQAAVNSSLYASRLDELLMHQETDSDMSLPKKRYHELNKSSEWFGQKVNDIRVPLIMAVNSTTIGMAETEKEHQVANVIPAEAIKFVLAPDDLNHLVRDILLSVRKKPIPVRSLLIEDSVPLQQMLAQAEAYVLFPTEDTTLNTIKGYEQQPWMPVINLHASTQFISYATAKILREQTRRDSYRHFLGGYGKEVTSYSDIAAAEPGARIAIFDAELGPGEPPLSHAMMMVKDAAAVGVNNQLIGGLPGWEKIWLGTLNWIQDKQLGFVIEADGHKYRMRIQQSTHQPEITAPEIIPEINIYTRRVLEIARNYASSAGAHDAKNAGMGEPSWFAIIRLYALAGAINLTRMHQLLNTIRPDDYQSLLGDTPQLARSLTELVNADAGSLLLFTEQSAGQIKGKPAMVHAMMMNANGIATGMNNQVIGQQPGWQNIDLAALKYDPDNRYGLVLLAGNRRFNCIISPLSGNKLLGMNG